MPVVMPQCVLFAAGAAEGRHALEIADHAGAVIDIAAAAGAARFSGAFVDVAAFVADGDFHVHAEIIAAGAGGDVKQLAVAASA